MVRHGRLITNLKLAEATKLALMLVDAKSPQCGLYTSTVLAEALRACMAELDELKCAARDFDRAYNQGGDRERLAYAKLFALARS